MSEETAKAKPLGADEDFITAYCKWDRSMIQNPALATLVFDSFCAFMQHRMINEQKPVNLGFVKLHALQMRATWKLAMYAKVCARKRDSMAKKRAFAREVMDKLAGEEMTGWDNLTATLDWTIEAVPQWAFKKNTQALEKIKRAGLTHEKYFLIAREQLKRQLPVAYEIFKTFLEEASKPMVRFPRDEYIFRNGFKRTAGKRYRTKPKCAPATRLMGVPPVNGGSLDLGSAFAVVSPNESMPEMPNLQSPEQDVRDTRNDVEKLDDSGSGTVGLHVLPASEKLVEGELLVVSGIGRNDGVAGIAELETVATGEKT